MDFFVLLCYYLFGDDMKDTTMLEQLTEIHFRNEIGMYYCGKRIETQNHIYGPEIRNHYLFVLVNKGTAVMCDGKATLFGNHDLLIMHPNERIHYKALEPWSISWLGLYGETVKEYMDLLGVSPQKPIVHISLYNELRTVMDNIYDMSRTISLSAKLSVTGLIYEFFSVLIQNSFLDQKTDLIKSALKIIDYNYCSNISVEQIAKRLSIDPAYFSRKFTEKAGVSPKKYILHKRMERAKELLSVTDAGIFEISNSVGYEDQLYFSRIFKKYTKISPTDYRKKFRETTRDYCSIDE